ncbi:MAG: glycosyltransferase family 1 protein [Ramlibacter sp.]|nr:glycosyltransferase family 1 protein [Ramlibacter sp.]
MRVGIDARFVTGLPRRGIGTYSLHLIRAMVSAYPDIEFFLFTRQPDLDGVLPRAPNAHVRQLTAPFYPLWEQVALPLAANRENVDILHCLGNTGPLITLGQARHVLTVHDVMFLQSGMFVPKPTTLYQKLGRWYRAMITPRCARNADAVITVSEFSKHDILALIPDVSPIRVAVTFEGCDPLFADTRAAMEAAAISPEKSCAVVPFIFCLGAGDPRKNTLRMVQAYLKLVRENGVAEDLVIAGYKNWENSLAYKEVLQAGVTNRVRFLPFVPVPELAILYRRATLFAYPSLYEGFGIPILEAFNAGCPVVASGVTSIPEVGGDAALYVDPESVDELAAAMLSVINDSSLRESMIAKGRARAGQFGWDRVANQTMDVYRRCLANN